MNILHYKLVGKTPIICHPSEVSSIQDRTIQRDFFGPVMVSTVFLPFDHSFGGDGPVLFETMIFDGEYDGYQKRYKTYDEAVEGHKVACDLVNRLSIERESKLNNLGI